MSTPTPTIPTPKKTRTLGQKALDTAKTQLGQCEKPLGSNWGEPVKTYLHTVGINFPASWCAAFVFWCFNQVADKNPLVKTGGVLKHWNEADKKLRVTEPKEGDIFIMDFGKGLGHTGIVEKVDSTFIYTIEGNSNDDGSRNGVEVVKHKRLKTKIKGYLRYA
jgi:hypothetical protein